MRHSSIASIATVVALALMASTGSSVSQEQQAAAREAAAPTMVVLGTWQADSILGKEVRSKTDESMGRLVDVIVDRTGRPRAAVIDFGGFLGVGSRKIAIDWNALSFESEGASRDVVTADLTRDQVKAAPEYKDRRAVIVLGSAGSISPTD